jgi:PAS domain S-box-containing protein
MNDFNIIREAIPQRQADRRQLQQIIAGLTEGILLLDTDGTIVWANEAALAMHGATTREELGVNVREYRERFILRYRNNRPVAEGDYPTDRVVAGEPLDGVTVEVTSAADEGVRWVHQVRSLVLTNAGGDPDCLVLVIRDATEQVSAEERFERAFGANPAPAIICRLMDLRYVKVNRGFLEMTGYAREDVLDRSVYEIDVLEQADRKSLAIELLNAGRTIPQMEAVLRLPDGSGKYVVVAGQPIEIGDERCMLFTFIDLDPRRKTENALRQSEERFSKAFNLSPLPTTVTTLDGFRINEVNEAFLATTGYTSAEVVGHSGADLKLWTNAADRKQFEQDILTVGSVRNRELQLRTKDGDLVDCLVSAQTITIDDQPCVLRVLQDITDRKRSEVELIAAIEAVMQDASWFSRTVIEKLATVRRPHVGRNSNAELADLTPRERDILGLICQGLADQDIAGELQISRNTVRNYVALIYQKIGVHRRSAAIVWARDRGFTGAAPSRTAVRGTGVRGTAGVHRRSRDRRAG